MKKTGIVSSINRENASARVYFEDMDDTVSPELKVLFPCTMNTKFFWMPEVGQTVVCLLSEDEPITGYILSSFYSDEDKVPDEFLTSEDIDGVRFPDGSFITYDSINHKLIFDIAGDIEFRSKTSPTFTTKE